VFEGGSEDQRVLRPQAGPWKVVPLLFNSGLIDGQPSPSEPPGRAGGAAPLHSSPSHLVDQSSLQQAAITRSLD